MMLPTIFLSVYQYCIKIIFRDGYRTCESSDFARSIV